MATLDFTELNKKPPGEALEALARLIGQRLGMVAQWSGRGADGGRDIYFQETQNGPLSSRSVRWLVNCKDKSGSNASVGENDVGSITDKVAQHKCDGFLLVTTTTPSTALKEKLDKLDVSVGGSLHTRVWDRFELTNYLLQDSFADLLNQFFPKQAARSTTLTLDAARETVERSVPRVVCGMIRRYLVPHADRLSLLSGQSIWPHDEDQSRLIDRLRHSATATHRLSTATKDVQGLHFDAFVVFIDVLIRNFPVHARRLLVSTAKATGDEGMLFNIIQILREYDDFLHKEEIALTERCDRESLYELYHELISDALTSIGFWPGRLPRSIESYADRISIEDIRIEDLAFEGGDGIGFSTTVRFFVYADHFDPELPSVGRVQFTAFAEGYLTNTDFELSSIVSS